MCMYGTGHNRSEVADGVCMWQCGVGRDRNPPNRHNEWQNLQLGLRYYARSISLLPFDKPAIGAGNRLSARCFRPQWKGCHTTSNH
jgi:hypothetical protein